MQNWTRERSVGQKRKSKFILLLILFVKLGRRASSSPRTENWDADRTGYKGFVWGAKCKIIWLHKSSKRWRQRRMPAEQQNTLKRKPQLRKLNKKTKKNKKHLFFADIHACTHARTNMYKKAADARRMLYSKYTNRRKQEIFCVFEIKNKTKKISCFCFAEDKENKLNKRRNKNIMRITAAHL